jgi:hypothetical protein
VEALHEPRDLAAASGIAVGALTEEPRAHLAVAETWRIFSPREDGAEQGEVGSGRRV